MTAYNVINPGSMVNEAPEDIATVLANFQAIATILNGGLDNENLAPAAGILPSKIANGLLLSQLGQSGAVAGQAPVWNGSSWVPGTVAPQLVTALPSSPTEGQEIHLTDSLTAPNYYWHLRYNATTTKWHFLGGSSLFAETVEIDDVSSTTYAAVGTAGPSITLPVAGDYLVEIGADLTSNSNAGNYGLQMSYDIGATGAVQADNIFINGETGHVSVARPRLKTGLGAVTLTAKYKVQSGTLPISKRWMRVTPVKLG